MDRLIFTDNLSLVEWKVRDMIADGFNLSGDPFVLGGHFCQWMTPFETTNEYKLVSAGMPSVLEQDVRQMEGQGYFRVFASVNFQGLQCQWMARTRGLVFAEAVKVEAVPTPALTMVESVQFLGSLSLAMFPLKAGGA